MASRVIFKYWGDRKAISSLWKKMANRVGDIALFRQMSTAATINWQSYLYWSKNP
jgi:hypothetical protein